MDYVGILFSQSKGEGHVLIYSHVAIEGIVLEYHCHVPVLGWSLGNVLSVQKELSVGDIFQSGHHSQCCGLSTAGRTYKNDKLSVLDIQVEIKDSLNVVVINLINML